jgi:hypothetical protein
LYCTVGAGLPSSVSAEVCTTIFYNSGERFFTPTLTAEHCRIIIMKSAFGLGWAVFLSNFDVFCFLVEKIQIACPPIVIFNEPRKFYN